MLDDTEDKKQIHTYREKSRRDSLTGLLNREASKEQITQYLEAVGTEGTAALMIIDIDNFKDINDTKGHLFGDSVLTEVAKCISCLLYTSGTLEGMILDKDYEHAIMESRNQLCQGKDILKTEFRIVRKDKSTRWVDCRGRIIDVYKRQVKGEFQSPLPDP